MLSQFRPDMQITYPNTPSAKYPLEYDAVQSGENNSVFSKFLLQFIILYYTGLPCRTVTWHLQPLPHHTSHLPLFPENFWRSLVDTIVFSVREEFGEGMGCWVRISAGTHLSWLRIFVVFFSHPGRMPGRYRKDHVYIFSFSLSLSMALQPFRPCPLFQFFNPIHSRQDSLDGGSALRKAATYTQKEINRE
jgi:hypothetical protein